jgi:flagellar biosynthesis protein FliQ
MSAEVFFLVIAFLGFAVVGGIVGDYIVERISEPIKEHLGFVPALIAGVLSLLLYMGWVATLFMVFTTI